MNIETYPVDQIDVGDRLRSTDPQRVAEIAQSIRDRGLLQPVGLSPEVEGRRTLVFGAHRLAAFKAAKGEGAAIPFLERDGSGDELRMMEIDENLYRNDLTAFYYAEFLNERCEIWQRLNRPFKRGRPKRNDHSLRQLDFFEDVRGSFNLSADTVQRALRRKRAICSQAWYAIKRAGGAWSGADLDRLADLEEQPELQIAAVAAVETSKLSVSAAISKVTKAEAAEPASFYDRLVRRWPKLEPDEQQRIKRWVSQQKIGGAA